MKVLEFWIRNRKTDKHTHTEGETARNISSSYKQMLSRIGSIHYSRGKPWWNGRNTDRKREREWEEEENAKFYSNCGSEARNEIEIWIYTGWCRKMLFLVMWLQNVAEQHHHSILHFRWSCAPHRTFIFKPMFIVHHLHNRRVVSNLDSYYCVYNPISDYYANTFSDTSLISLVNYFSFLHSIVQCEFVEFLHIDTHTLKQWNDANFSTICNPITIINLSVLRSQICACRRSHMLPLLFSSCVFFLHLELTIVRVRASFIKIWQATDCISDFKQSQKLKSNKKGNDP